ncbi:ankyrin repeat-containing domain, PGG domain protein [Artemisia annua]|uniref:Ankyrin repeat-containing domain, PGG domain protein n=1 Tax=Artemisia annua TaxID=35608 RepID=A0A2U1QPC5_ARTAN|nr:ankyrin repeat-containing domain, PGG domain protein [Artemisia annua]
MTNAASTSNPSFIVEVGQAYPYPSHVIAPNFVTTKLSGKNTYNVWETQILCLLKSHQMYGFIDGQFPRPAGNGKEKVGVMEAWIISDSLVKGWILGSLSDGVAKKVVNRLKPKHKNTDFTAKDLWDELQRSYGPSVFLNLDNQIENFIHVEKELATRQAESVIEVISESEEAKSKDEPTEEKTRKESNKRGLYDSIISGDIGLPMYLLEYYGLNPWDKLTNNGNTVLHVAVGSSTKNHHELLEKLLEMTPEENTLLDLVNSDGSSLLHVAAIGGHIKPINMLVERNPELLLATDNEGHTPLALSISNMHIKTSHCLFEHMKVYRYLLEEKEKEYDALLRGEVIMTCKTFEQQEKKYGDLNTGISGEDIKTSKCLLEQQKKEYDALFTGKSGEDLVVLAISCQDFRLSKMIINDYPDAIVSDSDAVLTALARNFPRELNFWERGWKDEFERLGVSYRPTMVRLGNYADSPRAYLPLMILSVLFMILLVGFAMLAAVFYQCLKKLVQPFIYSTFSIHEDATDLLIDVCNTILNKANSSTYHHYYTNSIFEATRQNASTFVRHIMKRFPYAIWNTNEEGHNFIQYSVISRSEKIYSLLYEMSEHKNIYKTIKDAFGNNLLHLAARLAPINKLNIISGAALQIQRELQWFKEVEQFVCPLNRLQKNSDDETPEMVFTREHKDLVIEGENWIKKTAESYTITAALIITIVFAAAITVPGGNNQESGIPIFTNNIALTVFAISDAISLFTAVTSLLMFLSILTARFAEQDFLFKLPTKLIIGLTMLFLSTTAMIIAFGATLFLVFGQGNLSMLIPIGALTCLPITSFVTLQCPLIVELIRATYGGGIFFRELYDCFY